MIDEAYLSSMEIYQEGRFRLNYIHSSASEKPFVLQPLNFTYDRVLTGQKAIDAPLWGLTQISLRIIEIIEIGISIAAMPVSIPYYAFDMVMDMLNTEREDFLDHKTPNKESTWELLLIRLDELRYTSCKKPKSIFCTPNIDYLTQNDLAATITDIFPSITLEKYHNSLICSIGKKLGQRYVENDIGRAFASPP